MKTSELTGENLDHAVVLTNGWELENYGWWKIERCPRATVSVCACSSGSRIKHAWRTRDRQWRYLGMLSDQQRGVCGYFLLMHGPIFFAS